MSKLLLTLARCLATALLGVLVLMVLGYGGAQAQVPVPPLAATLVQVCRGQPCLVTLPDVVPLQLHDKLHKSSKRLTRRST